MPAPRRKSAFTTAMKEAQQSHGETVQPLDSGTVEPSQSEAVEPFYRETPERLYSQTVTRRDGDTVQDKQEKTSFYLTPALLEKLDDLAHDYRKHTGHRVNRNDIVRYLVERCSL